MVLDSWFFVLLHPRNPPARPPAGGRRSTQLLAMLAPSRRYGAGEAAQNARSTTKLILDRDATPLWNGWAERTDAHTKTTIDLPAALALHDSTLIDHLIGAVFDQLWNGTIELRVRAPTPTTITSGHAGTTGIRT